EPGLNTNVVLNGTDVLPSLISELEPDGAWRTKVRVIVWPVSGSRLGVPGRATTTTGPRTESCCAAYRADRSNLPLPLRSNCWLKLKKNDVELGPPFGLFVGFAGAVAGLVSMARAE